MINVPKREKKYIPRVFFHIGTDCEISSGLKLCLILVNRLKETFLRLISQLTFFLIFSTISSDICIFCVVFWASIIVLVRNAQ